MLTRLTVIIIAQYIQILNQYVVPKTNTICPNINSQEVRKQTLKTMLQQLNCQNLDILQKYTTQGQEKKFY